MSQYTSQKLSSRALRCASFLIQKVDDFDDLFLGRISQTRYQSYSLVVVGGHQIPHQNVVALRYNFPDFLIEP